MTLHPDKGPRGAGGASGAIYAWLRMGAFPDVVRSTINGTGDACHFVHNRGSRAAHVIHVVGPDFTKSPGLLLDAAIRDLRYVTCPIYNLLNMFCLPRHHQRCSSAYVNTLSAFLNIPDVDTLRLLPISGGTFAASLNVPKLTAGAILRALQMLSESDLAALCTKTIHMCIRSAVALPAFSSSFLETAAAATGVAGYGSVIGGGGIGSGAASGGTAGGVCRVVRESAVAGITNYGNTCYIATVVQSLMSVPALRDYFTGSSFDTDIVEGTMCYAQWHRPPC